MKLDKLNIAEKIDNPAKKKFVESGEIDKAETLVAKEVNSMVDKINQIIDYQDEAFSLKVNTIAELRQLEGKEGQIINLLGYYQAGDKEPLNYKWSFEQDEDDGGSVINSGKGSWKAITKNYVKVSLFNDLSILKALNVMNEVIIDKEINLQGQVLTISENKTVTFLTGGLIKNGLINFNRTIVNNAHFENCTFSGTLKNNEILYSGYNDVSVFMVAGNTNVKVIIDQDISLENLKVIEVKNLNITGIGSSQPKLTNISIQATEDIEITNIEINYTGSDSSTSSYFIAVKHGKSKRSVKVNNVKKLKTSANNLAYVIRELLIATGDRTGISIDFLEIKNCEINNISNSFVRLPIDILSGSVSFNKVDEVGGSDRTRAVGIHLGFLGGVSKDLDVSLNRITNLRTTYGAINDGTFCNGIIIYADDSVIYKNYVENLWGFKNGAYTLDSGMDHEGIYLKGNNATITYNTIIDASGELSDAAITIKSYRENNKIEGNNIVINNGGKAMYCMYERQLDVINNNIIVNKTSSRADIVSFHKELGTDVNDSVLNIDSLNIKSNAPTESESYVLILNRCSGVVNIKNCDYIQAKNLQFLRVLKSAEDTTNNSLEINIINSNNIYCSGNLKPFIANNYGSLYINCSLNIINSSIYVQDLSSVGNMNLTGCNLSILDSGIEQVSGDAPSGLIRFNDEKNIVIRKSKLKLSRTSTSTYMIRTSRQASYVQGTLEISDSFIFHENNITNSKSLIYDSATGFTTGNLLFSNNQHNYSYIVRVATANNYTAVFAFNNNSLLNATVLAHPSMPASQSITEFNNQTYGKTPLVDKANFIADSTATDITQLKDDFNALLNNLKLNGIMKSL